MSGEQWNQLLHQYVNSQGRVDYASWQSHSVEALAQWLAETARLDVQSLTPPEQLALWLNLYNALTIAKILRRYPLRSIRPQILGIPNWIAFFWFFLRPMYTIAGHRYSLAEIENRVLRQQFAEPRIHFALVCASIGCPLLRAEAYDPARVFQQLEEDADRFINNPEKVRYDAQSGMLYCSKIFKWYRQDFLNVAPSIPDYMSTYLAIPLSATTPIRYLPYSWNLNTQSPVSEYPHRIS